MGFVPLGKRSLGDTVCRRREPEEKGATLRTAIIIIRIGRGGALYSIIIVRNPTITQASTFF